MAEIYICNVLGFVDCSLTSETAGLVLDDLVRLEYVETLDLANNKIGINPEPFFKWWKRNISGVDTVNKLILSNNDLLEDSKSRLISDFEKCSPECQVIF